MQDEIATLPVVGWDTFTVPSYGAAILRIRFFSSPFLTKTEEADPGRNYAFSLLQLRALRDSISEAIDALEKAGFQPAPGPKQ